MGGLTGTGPVVSSIAPRRDLRPQLERIVSYHLAHFPGVPLAVMLPDPRGLAAVAVDGHVIPIRAGWPADADADPAHSVAVLYPPQEQTL